MELLSSKLCDEILAAGEISIFHMKLKVVEYYSQANVLICSNCCGIGHFRKNCTQKGEAPCKTYGEKCANLKDHQCTGIMKCIHCGGPHGSNDKALDALEDPGSSIPSYRSKVTRGIFYYVLKNVKLFDDLNDKSYCQSFFLFNITLGNEFILFIPRSNNGIESDNVLIEKKRNQSLIIRVF